MASGTIVLLGTAASIGWLHTLIGPDHYLPFIVMSKVRGWSMRKTLLITFLCGLGHVLSSIVIAGIGIGLGVAVARLEVIEAARGNIASWVLIAFGLAYMVWGIRRALRNRSHSHAHVHENGDAHNHKHGHSGDHTHVHDEQGKSVTPWVLFVIFVLGPCEPLIPILMVPAATGGVLDVAAVAGVFSVVTIATMLGVVLIAQRGLMPLPLGKIQRFSHALAGLAIFASGGAMKLFGL